MSDDNIDILPPEEELIVIAFTLTGCILSLFGAMFIIWAYLKFDSLRSFAFRLIYWLSISDFLFCAGKLLTIFELKDFPDQLWTGSPSICQIQALLINYGGLASITCTVAIAWTLHTSLVRAPGNIEQTYERPLFYFSFGLPFAFTLIPLFTGDYGARGSWCWIIKSDRSLFLRFFEFYVPLWLAILYNAITYYQVIKFLKEEMHEGLDHRLMRRFLMYPLILVFCWSWATVNRIRSLFYKESLVLNILHRLFGSLQGLLNAIIYGMNQNVRYALRCYLRQHWLFKKCYKEDPIDEGKEENDADSPLRKTSTNQIRLLRLARTSSEEIELQMKQLHSEDDKR
jgi:hypothetical protein